MASIPDMHVTLQVDDEKLREALQRSLEEMKSGKFVTLEPGMVYSRLPADYSRYDRDEWVNVMKQQERRLKRFSITAELLCQLFVTGTRNVLITHGLPSDAVVRNVRYEPDYECFDFVVWHLSFDIVKVGEAIPQFMIDVKHEVDDMRVTNAVE